MQDNSKIVDKKINIAQGEEDLLKYSIVSNQNITHRKIQLWTNKHQNEFAIRLTTDSETLATSDDDDDDRNIFLATTDANEDYIRVVAETDYFKPLKHGWEYTLRHLIEQYKHEVRTISLRKIASTIIRVITNLAKKITIQFLLDLFHTLNADIVIRSLKLKNRRMNMN